MHESKKCFPGLFWEASPKMSRDPELTELLLGLRWESRSCSTGDPGHPSPSPTEARRQDARDGWDPRPPQAQAQHSRKKTREFTWERGSL